MRLQDLRIGTRLGLGFSAVLALTLACGVLALAAANRLSDLTSQLFEHPYTVTSAIRDAQVGVLEIQRDVRRALRAENEAARADYIQRIGNTEERVLRDLELARDRYLGPPEDVDAVRMLVKDWRPLRDRLLQTASAGGANVIALDAEEGNQAHLIMLEDRLGRVVAFADRKAQAFHAEAEQVGARTLAFVSTLLVAAFLASVVVSVVIARGIARPLGQAVLGIRRLAAGALDADVDADRGDELGELGQAVERLVAAQRQAVEQADRVGRGDLAALVAPRSAEDSLGHALVAMTEALRRAAEETRRAAWLKEGQTGLDEVLRGEPSPEDLARLILDFLARYLGAPVGVLYLRAPDGRQVPAATFGLPPGDSRVAGFGSGEGLVGQAARDGRPLILAEVPGDYLLVRSGLGEAPVRGVAVVPLWRGGAAHGVLELGTMTPFGEEALRLLGEMAAPVAIALEAARSRQQLERALVTSREQAARLQEQQEELRVANEELSEQAAALRESRSRLQDQQEELRVSNEELEETAARLEDQTRSLELKNVDLTAARHEMERRADDLATASRYKSQFLANMSHELRTPLNSLLLLARSLSDNRGGNLSAEQVESARIIHKSGQDLLHLINEILDLSKIEAGRMEPEFERVRVAEAVGALEREQRLAAQEKGLAFSVEVAPGTPETLETDGQRLEQILRNLLSNAIKFTAGGEVALRVGWAAEAGEPSLAFAVTDTGLGVAPEHQQRIFEAFQQAEGGTSRRFGGTGLGLTISRELARLLGGTLGLVSTPGEGSTFTLVLPVRHRSAVAGASPVAAAPTTGSPAPSAALRQAPPAATVPDDRDKLVPGDRVILVVEDDPGFATVLRRKCHEEGFKCLVAGDGRTGLELAAAHRPAAVILDIMLPGMDGWSVLDALKRSPHLRHIPVHVMSAMEPTLDAMRRGAIAFLPKPASPEQLSEAFRRLAHLAGRGPRRLLVVEDDPILRELVVDLVGGGDVTVVEAATGAAAQAALRAEPFDCMVLDLGLSDMSGFDLLERLEAEGTAMPPVVVHTARDLTREEAERLRRHAESVIIKGVKSEERLLDETSLFLHRVVEELPERHRKMIASLHDRDAMFSGKQVLLVDDDMRNTFALAKLLRERGMAVHIASDGLQALALLDEHPETEVVLMDVMMPELDGYEATRRIRAQERFARLPVIALTAKAMKDDRARCMAAGASDYLSKPVDLDRLLSMLRVWLYR